MLKNTLLLDAAKLRPTNRRPVWLMRQAGRYMPEYQKIRSQYDFLDLCKTPEAAAEVSMQPFEILGVDAIIIFNDILLPAEAMGMELVFTDSKGPQFPRPLRSAGDIKSIKVADPATTIPQVGETIQIVKDKIQDAVPIIGFAGAPWTLAAYMIEGGGSRNFEHIKTMMWNQPNALHDLLKKLTETVIAYLRLQLDAGASAFQVFDTWGGSLAPDEWQQFSLPYITQIFSAFEECEQPGMLFVKGGWPNFEDLVTSGAEVVSVDWMTRMNAAKKVAAGRVALQGNMDPVALFAKIETIEMNVKSILQQYGDGPGLICNLGHGILPKTPVSHVQAFVDAVKKFSVTSK